MNMIFRGGWVMVPIIAASIAALAISLDRALYYWKIRPQTAKNLPQVMTAVKSGRYDQALELCAASSHPIFSVIKAGISEPTQESIAIEKAMEKEGALQMHRAEEGMSYLGLIVGLCPMMGFLGTILGLIQAFMSWEKFSTSVTVSQLAAGIYQAMITTAAGLIVAIPYFVIYHVFLAWGASLAMEMTEAAEQVHSNLRRKR